MEMDNITLIKKYMVGERPQVNEPLAVYDQLKDLFNAGKELFICLHLDSKNKVICREIAHIGGLNQTLIEPRAIFRNSIILNANSVILAHNHPSGDLAPSNEDLKQVKILKRCGNLLGIPVLDNLIFNHTNCRSINKVCK